MLNPTRKLVQSPNLVLRRLKGQFLAYNSLFGFPNILNDQCVRVLKIFSKPISLSEVRKGFCIERLEGWCQFFMENHFLVFDDQDERADLKLTVEESLEKISRGEQLESLGLIVEEACNFDCLYCISKKLIQTSQRSVSGPYQMSWLVAKKAVDEFVVFSRKNHQKKLEIYFGGSEPLLNWRLMRKVISYCLDVYGNEFSFSFSTNTNSSLITLTRAEFLCRQKVTITTSLDGSQRVNDKVRRLLSGRGTFEKIISGWNNLERCGQKVEWFCLTLTDQNIEEIDEAFLDFVAARGITSCSFEPDIILPLKKSPEEVVSALLKFRKWGEERGITVGGLWDKPLKNMFESDVRKKLFNCSAFTGRGISVLPSGDILPCSYSATKLGRIGRLDSIFRSDRFKSFITSRAIGNIEACRGCEIEGQCMGGCYITTEYAHYAGTETFDYRCQIFRGVTPLLLEEVVRGGDKTSR